MLRRAAATLAALILAPVPAALGAETRAFHGVSRAVYECSKDIGESRHGTVYEPRHADYGTATTASFFWIIVIAYSYSPATGTLDHTILERSWIIPVASVWAGIGDQLAECEARLRAP